MESEEEEISVVTVNAVKEKAELILSFLQRKLISCFMSVFQSHGHGVRTVRVDGRKRSNFLRIL